MIQRLAILASEVFGRSVLISGTEDAPVPDAVPPLTSAELTTFGELVAMVRSGMTGLTLAQFRTVREQLPALRAVRQLTRNQFVNLSDADRARMIYDAIVADTVLWLTLLRE